MTTAAAAAAALPAQPEEARPERIAWVDVESAPQMTEIRDAVGNPLGWYPEYDPSLGLTDLMADKFREVCENVDQSECEANGCAASPYERDGEPIGAGVGWGLAGEADERTEWRGVTLVQHGRAVIAVCEACSPSVVYDDLFTDPEE